MTVYDVDDDDDGKFVNSNTYEFKTDTREFN